MTSASLGRKLALALMICGLLLARCVLPLREVGFMEITVNRAGTTSLSERIIATALASDESFVAKISPGSGQVFWSASGDEVRKTAFVRVTSEGCETVTIPVTFSREYVPPGPPHIMTAFYRYTAYHTVTLKCQ
jgi:hypothetical protein